MASHIGRRKFLATLGGATAWPLAARRSSRAKPAEIPVEQPTKFDLREGTRPRCASDALARADEVIE
jgi:hypothetical protein